MFELSINLRLLGDDARRVYEAIDKDWRNNTEGAVRVDDYIHGLTFASKDLTIRYPTCGDCAEANFQQIKFIAAPQPKAKKIIGYRHRFMFKDGDKWMFTPWTETVHRAPHMVMHPTQMHEEPRYATD